MSFFSKDYRFRHRMSSITATIDTPPVLSAVTRTLEFFEKLKTGNRYEVYDAMTDIDPDLDGDIESFSILCGRYYDGICFDTGEGIVQDPEKMPEKFSDHTDTLKEAIRFASSDYGLDFRELFKGIGARLRTDGDILFKIVYGPTGIVDLDPLPMRYMTAVPHESFVGDHSSVGKFILQHPEVYIYKEVDGPPYRQTYKKEDVLHISLNKTASWVEDLFGRPTYGMWSKSPLQSLQTDLRWIVNTKLNDILVRHKMVPRLVHKLNLSMYTPDRYPDQATYADKVTAAQEDAKAVADAYREELEMSGEQLDADQE